ncbi:MAG: hypothetical protein EZS26_000714 [Candidatus Ordinivivax streblomastigis]|uniref:Uncharacterized protein n=1 Tax=Candidatus Ordinivivax streblomastigis TaxID=2540710 RepID=A0A5M8P3Y4_9BACT|nr:MAG: hypothetical protein EZS26_000714 [Candidatus Ordinivivax streblomastigis]
MDTFRNKIDRREYLHNLGIYTAIAGYFLWYDDNIGNVWQSFGFAFCISILMFIIFLIGKCKFKFAVSILSGVFTASVLMLVFDLIK